MAHQSVTLSQSIPMPRHTYLMRRGSRYYFNMKVPVDLREVLKKQIIRQSLRTSDVETATRRVRVASLKHHAQFGELRAKSRLTAPWGPQNLQRLTDEDAYELVVQFFIQEEREAEEWWEHEGRKLNETGLRSVAEELKADAAVFQRGGRHYLPDECSGELRRFLNERNLTCPEDSADYRKLLRLFRRAKLENIHRTIEGIYSGTRSPSEPIFRQVFAHTARPASREIVPLDEMLKGYVESLTRAKRARGTLRTYSVPIRLLRESLGRDTPVGSIRHADVEKLFELLRRAPKNATQRYPGLTLKEAVAAAEKAGDETRLGPKVLANYFNNIAGIFNFAVQKKFITENPASDRWLRASFEISERPDKALFTIAELNLIFRAPLYTGCKDDGLGYAKPGVNTPRGGRFWLPLIALFHGLRSNEAAQLHTEDVKEEDGIMYFYVRRLGDDGRQSEKSTKTVQSKRKVPIHPELFRLGFPEYVHGRQRDLNQCRLFPELPRSAAGYLSDPFGKWFGRFVEKTLGKQCKATFNSFRHHFRSALFEGDVSTPVVEALGGWELGRRSAEKNYLRPGLKRLRDDIAKVKYPGLNISHLYT
jgi:integrase